ncbi:O-antigen ligase family protein [Streptomyces sp. NPDC055929]|uniref:O-antigen ligase family protein n=1 Tax=Streptomyces sp. NPDC055929 TaxID=3345662 RepID=UPI0035DB608A
MTVATAAPTASPAPGEAPSPAAGAPAPAPRRARPRTDRLLLLPLLATVLLLALPLGRYGGPGTVAPADIASGVLVAACLLRLVRRRERPLGPAAAAVFALPVVGFAVATVTAADPVAALPGLVRYLQVFVLVPCAVMLLLRDAGGFRAVTGALVALALVQGAIGTYQFATGTGASYRGAEIRAVGTFGPTDVMGMATVVSYGFLAALALALSPPQGAHRRLRPAALAAAGLLLVPLGLSFSRGAWIATALAALAVLLLDGPRRAVKVLAAAVAAGVVLAGGLGVGSEAISQRIGSITQVTDAPDRSVTDRYSMWAAAVSMWQEEPATGVGLKGFPAHRDAHASLGLSAGSDTAGAGRSFEKQPLLSPHNMYLLVLGEQGLVGATAFLASWLALLLGAVRRLVRAAPGAPLDCGLAATGLMLWQAVDFLYADIGGPSTVLTGVVVGLAAWWALGPAPAPAAAPASGRAPAPAHASGAVSAPADPAPPGTRP